jgi:hypothetical protein
MNAWMSWIVVVGVIYSPNHQNSRWGGLLSMGAPDSPVRQPRHQLLGFWQFRPLELWLLGAPDSPVPHGTGTVHCPVCLLALLWLCANCLRTVHVVSRSLKSTVALATVALLGTLDSPVSHRTVRWIIAESHLRNPKVKSLKLIHPGAPDTVRWHTGQYGTPDQGSLRFLLLLSFEP